MAVTQESVKVLALGILSLFYFTVDSLEGWPRGLGRCLLHGTPRYTQVQIQVKGFLVFSKFTKYSQTLKANCLFQ